jgi:4-hydroxy-tetrahydrodipicolinate synthase
MAIFTGAGVAIVTPFHADGSINYDKLEEIIDFQCNNVTDSIIICGTTGECATMSEAEHIECVKMAVEFTKGRIPVIAGTGSNSTQTAIELSVEAEKAGADALLMVTPYYNKGTEDGIEKHYLNIAESVDLPIIVYNVPSRTGVNLGINLLDRLANHENIVGIKEASDSTDRLVTLAAFGDKLALYAGNDSQIYPTLALGGSGVISVVANILPKATKALCDGYFEGKHTNALRLQLEMLPFIKTLFLETNPSPIKYAMEKVGLCTREVRLPLSEPRESTKEEIDRAFNSLLGKIDRL